MKTLLITVIVFCALVVGIVYTSTKVSEGSSPSGLPTNIASTTAQSVSTTARLLVATSTCDARIITTRAQPVMLTFSDYNGPTPSATFGHLQSASTTVVYDSGQWGCGAVKVYAFGTDSITVSETR